MRETLNIDMGNDRAMWFSPISPRERPDWMRSAAVLERIDLLLRCHTAAPDADAVFYIACSLRRRQYYRRLSM